MISGFAGAQFEIVLKPEQDIGIAHRFEHIGFFGCRHPGRRAQLVARQHSAVEGIPDHFAPGACDAQEEMARRAQAESKKTCRPRRVHVENAQSDGQAPAPLDDAYQVGISGIVVVQPVAVIAMAGQDHRQNVNRVFGAHADIRGARGSV